MLIRDIDWGDDSAERDRNLLSYFVDTESYARLRRRSKFLVIGRKGSGKSALRKKLQASFSEEDFKYVVNITPNYSSIRNIVNEASLNNGFGEEIFFQHSWLRQLMLDSLCKIGHEAKGVFAKDSLAFARQVSVDLNRTSKDIVENISELLGRLEVKAGHLGELGISLERELRDIADVDSLEYHLKALAESGAKITIMIDDLDLGWDNSDVSNNMLLGLLSASSYLMSISDNIHVFIFLREDVYTLLMEQTQHSDKYRNVERVRWDKPELIQLLQQRINFNAEVLEGESANFNFYAVFPATIGTHNTDNWLTERTLSRPRELIQLARFYTEDVEGEHPDDSVLKSCETTYSSWKLDDLCTEYTNQYPGLSEVFAFWKNRFYRNKYHLQKEEIEEKVLTILGEAEINRPWFNKLVDDVDIHGFLSVLYEIGFIGDFVLGGDGGSKTFFSYSDRHTPVFDEIQIHQCFRKSVNTVDRIRTKK